jgi:EAL domain-containing protein (putative c-di-GMP-specific phosphodiesterase class I)
VAEETGQISRIGAWVLRQACRQAASWQPAPDGRPLSINVNVSGHQINEDLPGVVAQVLSETGLAPRLLILEMTESVLLNHEETLPVLRELKKLGIRLAIDDFGTGYSSLSYLHRFPVDVLKIDRSFVLRLSESDDATDMLQAIVRLARSLLMSTVAEGIEEDSQRGALYEMGCEFGQGFFLARPAPADHITRMLRGKTDPDELAPVAAAPQGTGIL